jgi:trehalose 6-phosphate phosphatase
MDAPRRRVGYADAVTAELRNATDFQASAVLAAAVDRLVAATTRSGLFFDFDGVLSRIQDHPEEVRPTDGAPEALEQLSTVVGRMAVVSSRSAEFIHRWLVGVPGLEIYGLYGLEHVENSGRIAVEPAAQQWVAAVQELRDQAVRELPDVYVEDKKLSVGLHYRLTPHLRNGIESWARRAAERTGFTMQAGRMVVELKPPITMDKGSVLTKLTQNLNAAWFFGDDLGDLPAFAALHRRAEQDGRFSGLAVSVGNDTVVDEVREQSDVFLTSPEILVELLRYVRQEFDR